MISKPRDIKTCLPVFMPEVLNQNDEVISFQKKEKSVTKIAKDIGVNPNIVDMTSLLANGHDRGVRNTPVFLLPVVKARDEKK
jgi:hypothetical protein